jgi:hypothetical protein
VFLRPSGSVNRWGEDFWGLDLTWPTSIENSPAIHCRVEEELLSLPGMRQVMAEAVEQAVEYGRILAARYGNLRLRRNAVVALGFERIWAHDE